jgi:hypothetical protein
VGAGTFRARIAARELTNGPTLSLALHAMMQQIAANQQLIMIVMSLMGECPTRWIINDELGDLGLVDPPLGALFRFLRYDIKLEDEWLRTLGVSADAETLRRARRLDDSGSMRFLEDVARKAAERQVLPDHWTR